MTALYKYKKYLYITLCVICFTFSGMSTPVFEDATISFSEHAGFILVEAEVNHVRGSYILDTGSQYLITNSKVTHPTDYMIAIDREYEVEEYEIEKFDLGPISLDGMAGFKMDLSHVESIVGVPLAGLVGLNVFEDYAILIDYDTRTLSAVKSSDANKMVSLNPESVVRVQSFTFEDDHLPVIQMEVNGEFRNIGLDSGATVSVMHSDDQSTSTHFTNFAFQNVKVQQVPYIHSDLSTINDNRDQQLDMILSLSSLNASNILIDFKRMKVYFFWKKPGV